MKTILLIEDDESIAEVIGIILKGEGYTVITDNNGKIITQKTPPNFDIAIVDYLLPGMTGGEIITIIKNNPHTKKTPIILMSANTESELANIARNLKVAEYLAKPFDIKDLIKRVKQLS